MPSVELRFWVGLYRLSWACRNGPIANGTWLLPPSEEDVAHIAPDDWQPDDATFRLVVFLQPH